jgi:opacity protein-like surface antigen
MKARLCAVLVCAVAIAVIAQSVDGKWSGEVQGGRGPQQVNLTLKADGGKLTGSVTGRGGEIPIQEGTISGTALKFKTQQQGRGGAQVTFNWNGTLKGDEIAMSRIAEGGQGQAQEFVLKREK